LKTYALVILSLIGISTFVAEFGFLSHSSHGHWWNHIPGFYALWGFIGSVGLILISRLVGRVLIQKKEDFYDGQ
jgi:hypothetical protein